MNDLKPGSRSEENWEQPAPAGERGLAVYTPAGAVQRRDATRFTPMVKMAGNAILLGSAVFISLPLFSILISTAGLLSIQGVAFLTAMLIAVSLVDNFALVSNERMRESCEAEVRARHPDLTSGCLGFVGFSTADHLRSLNCLVDTHQDVGLLYITSRSLLYFGDSLEVKIDRDSITTISRRIDPNFSWIGLHWIRITYRHADSQRHIYIQSRDRSRISLLSRHNEILLQRLKAWLGTPTKSH